MISKSTLLIFTLFFFLYGTAPVMAKEAAEKASEPAPTFEGVDATDSAVAGDTGQTAQDAVSAVGELPAQAPVAVAAPTGENWAAYPPDVKVSKWGSELRIVVTPNPAMDDAKKLEIQSVKLETEKGEFLGLKTYGPKETDRTAEFMVNPEILKIDKVKLTVNGQTDGDWVHTQSLEIKEEAPVEEKKPEEISTSDNTSKATSKTGKAAPAASAASEKPKKKGMFW